MKTIFVLLSALLIAGCSSGTTTLQAPPPITIKSQDFNSLFQKWEQDIKQQLDMYYSKIHGDRLLVKEIGKQAHLHEEILFCELKRNMFAYELLDASEQLLKKYDMKPFKGGAVQDQQQKWLDAYQNKKR